MFAISSIICVLPGCNAKKLKRFSVKPMMTKACGKTMTAVFASREEEMMKKIAEKAMKALAASPLCRDLPNESKEHVAEACERCLRQISIADSR